LRTEKSFDFWLSAASPNPSRGSAYSEQEFPVTGDGARCVLCLQELDEVASKRLISFESFVQNESKLRADKARLAYQEALSAATDARLSLAELRAILTLLDDELGKVDLADQRGLSSKQVAKIIFRGRSPPPTKIESDNGKASKESCPPSVHKDRR
jgi:hypothetical protein